MKLGLFYCWEQVESVHWEDARVRLKIVANQMAKVSEWMAYEDNTVEGQMVSTIISS